jgi:hypothetical protein
MSRERSLEPGPGRRLLGGWDHLLEDLQRLRRRISSADGQCACGHDAGVHAGCPCCARAARNLAAVCDVCSTEVRAIDGRLRLVEEDALRFLPTIFDLFATTPERRILADQLQDSLRLLLLTFRHLVSEVEEWAVGCPAAHLPRVKTAAEEVGLACRRFDDALRNIAHEEARSSSGAPSRVAVKRSGVG